MSKDLIEKEKALAQEKAEHIESLIDERERLTKATATRMGEIADELKALGWKTPRKARTVASSGTVEPAQQVEEAYRPVEEAGMMNDQQDGPYDIRS